MKTLHLISLLLHLAGANKIAFLRKITRFRGGSTSMQQLQASMQNNTSTAAPQQVSQEQQQQQLKEEEEEDEVHQKGKESHPSSVRADIRKKSLLDPDSISLSLRLVCELNRQLASGQSDKTSIFYTPPSKRTELSKFTQNLCKTFDHHGDPYISAITMIYLDRACSVETYRHDGDQSLPCPHLNISNVHKLYLAANVLALRTYRNEWPAVLEKGCFHDDITQLYCKKLQASGDEALRDIHPYELGTLLEWMFSSLGARGLAIEVEEASIFIENWKLLFEWENIDQTP